MTLNAAQAVRAYGESPDVPRAPHLELYGKARSGLAAHLERMRDKGMQLRYQRNETIFAEHDVATHIYYVAGGCVRLCRHVADGRRHISEFMFAGDLFGLGEFRTYPHSAEAVNSVTAIAYPRAVVEQFGWESGQLRMDMMEHFSTMLANTRQRLFRASCQSARERTASFILQMSHQTATADRVDLPMGRQEIADHLGLTIETVCRAITALREAGTIEIPNPHQFIVRRPDELRAMAEGFHTN